MGCVKDEYSDFQTLYPKLTDNMSINELTGLKFQGSNITDKSKFNLKVLEAGEYSIEIRDYFKNLTSKSIINAKSGDNVLKFYTRAFQDGDYTITTAEEFLNDIDGTIESMVEALAGLQTLYEEGNEWAGIFIQIANIRLGLQDILAIMKTKATKEQMEQLLAQVENIGEGIDQLVAVADYDYDGVINALDKCPETPLTKINEVNANGCAPGETPVSDD